MQQEIRGDREGAGLVGLVEEPVERVDPEVRPALGGRVQHGEGRGAAHVLHLPGRVVRIAVHGDDIIGAVAQHPGALDGDQLIVSAARREGEGHRSGSHGTKMESGGSRMRAESLGAGDARKDGITHIAVRK